MSIKTDFQKLFDSTADQILSALSTPLAFSRQVQPFQRKLSERSIQPIQRHHYNSTDAKVSDLMQKISQILENPSIKDHLKLTSNHLKFTGSLIEKVKVLEQIQKKNPLEPLNIADYPLYQGCINMLNLFNETISQASSPEKSLNMRERKNSLSTISTRNPPEKPLPVLPFQPAKPVEQLPVIEKVFAPLPTESSPFVEKLKTLKPFTSDHLPPNSPSLWVSRETSLDDLIKYFYAACAKGDIKTLEHISSLMPLNTYKKILRTPNEAGYNLVQQACLDQDHALVRFLLTDREFLNTKTPKGQTLLHLVVQKTGGLVTNGALANELIQLGIRPDKKDKQGQTPLNIAEKNNDQEMVQVLRKKLPLDRQFSEKTPLNDLVKNFNVACARGDVKTIQQISRFISKDFYTTMLNKTSEAGYTLVQQACLNLDWTMVSFLLLNKEVLITKTPKGQTLLHLVQQTGDFENTARAIAKKLIQFGIRPDEKDREGNTPLDIAIKNQDEKMINILNSGPDLSQEEAYSKSTGATVEDLEKEISLLKSKKGTLDKAYIKDKNDILNKVNVNGLTHLHVACYNLKSDLVNFLLGHKIDVSPQDPYGNTPLHIVVATVAPYEAAKKRRLSIIEVLLQAKAPLDVKNGKNETLLAIAEKMGDLEVVDLFKKYQG